MASNGHAKGRRTSNAIILDSDNEGAVNENSHPMPPPVTTQKPPQAPNPKTDDDDSDDELPARVTTTNDLPIRQGVKRKSSELVTGKGAQQPEKDLSSRKITYHVKIAPFSERKKIPSKRVNKARLLKVSQSLTWDELQDAIVEKAADALGLSVLICNYDNFETLFTIARKIPDPTPLQAESDYEILLESINNIKEPAVNIFVCHLTPVKKRKKTKGKENKDDHSSSDSSDSSNSGSDSDASGGERKKKGKKKSKKGKGKKKPKNVLEDEVTENVKRLRERWQCSVADGSDFCYWSHDEPKHFPLRHEHFRAWAQALLKHDDDIATTEKPPNHEIFNDVPVRARAKGSPLLEWRLQNMKTSQNSAASSSTPIIHVHMPNTTAPSHASPSAIVPACADTLVTHQKIGPDLSTDDFCRIYGLGNEILGRLKDNGYQRARTFKRVLLAQLREMGFKHGEIASLQDAVEEWAVSSLD